MEPIKGRVKKFFPILSWIGDYNLSKGIQDLLAGSTVGLLVIPQGIAFATIAGLPPQYGLYSAFMSSFAYMIFGTVPSVVIGPTTLMALMCFPFTSTNVANAPILSLLTGIIITLCGAFQFGFLLDFVSTPVISGFTTAASITIASSQLKNLLGINVTEKASDWWPGILHTYANIGLNLPSWNWSDALLGFTCMLILIGLRSLQNPLAIDGNFGKVLRLFIGSRNVIVVLSATIFAFTVETPLSLTGQIETGLPSISLPLYGLTNDFWSHIKSLGSVIISLPLISALSHVAVAKSFSRGQKLDANQELLAVGLCNILGSFVWAMPVSGSFNRTAVNRASGAQTTFGGLFSGTIVLSALHFMMPFCAYIPKSSLAAIIVSSIIFNIDIAIFSTLWKISRFELIPLCATIIGCLFWRLELGILLGIFLNLFQVIHASAMPEIKCKVFEGQISIAPTSGLSYASANAFRNAVDSFTAKHCDTRIVVLDLSRLTVLDYTATSILYDTLSLLEERKMKIIIIGIRQEFRARLLVGEKSCQKLMQTSFEPPLEEA